MKNNIVELTWNHYAGDGLNPTRQVRFSVNRTFLEEYLGGALEDEGEDLDSFLEDYNSDDAEEIYHAATFSNEIRSENIWYCEAFLADYQESGGNADKEDFYWNVWAKD